MRVELLLPDLHCPFQDKRAIDLIQKFKEDLKPDGVVALGDLLDFNGISHWNRRKYLTQVECSIDKDYEEADKVIKQLGITTIFEGNHERRIVNFRDEHPALGEKLFPHAYLDLKNRGIEYVWEDKQPKAYGKLRLTHEPIRRGSYAPQNHAKLTAQIYDHSVVYAHYHDVQSHVCPTSESYSRREAVAIGCLCSEKLIEYIRKKPTNWMLAFAVLYWTKDAYSLYVIRIPKYQFIWNGKLYKN